MMSVYTILFISVFFLSFLIILEFFKRRFNIDSEYTRKFAHIFGGLAVIVLSIYINKTEYLALTLFFLFLFIVSFKKKVLQIFSSTTRKTYGEITYVLGLILLGIFLFDNKSLFTCGLLILILPDAFAGLIGYKIRKSKKNLAASAVYFTTATWLLLQFFSPTISIIISIILSVVEFCSPLGLDNFTVPAVFILLSNYLL